MQYQNTLFLLRQGGKGIGHKLVPNWQVISMRRKNMAVAGIAVYRGELVHFFLRQDAQRYMTVAQAVHFPQIVNGLMFQYQLAIAVKLARSAKAGDSSHLLTPFRRGMVVVLSLSANRAK